MKTTKCIALLLAIVMTLALFAGCSNSPANDPATPSLASQPPPPPGCSFCRPPPPPPRTLRDFRCLFGALRSMHHL